MLCYALCRECKVLFKAILGIHYYYLCSRSGVLSTIYARQVKSMIIFIFKAGKSGGGETLMPCQQGILTVF